MTNDGITEKVKVMSIRGPSHRHRLKTRLKRDLEDDRGRFLLLES